MEKMYTCTRMRYQVETWLNVKLQYVQLSPAGVGPFVRSMKIVVRGFVTVLLGLREPYASVLFVQRIHADMEAPAWAVRPDLDFFAYVQSEEAAPFVKMVTIKK